MYDLIQMYDLKAVGSPTSNLWLKRMIQMYNPKAVGSPASNLHNLDLEADLQRQPVTFFSLTYFFLLHNTYLYYFMIVILTQAAARAPRKQNLGPLSDISQQVMPRPFFAQNFLLKTFLLKTWDHSRTYHNR